MRCLTTIVLISCLGALGCAVSNPASKGRTTQIWSGAEPDFLTGDISPDGRYFSDIDWDTGDLLIVDLATGEPRRLTGQGYEQGGYAWTSRFSTDGGQLAVSWYRDEAGRHEMRVLNVDGSASRVVIPAQRAFSYIDPLDWSPADTHVLVGLRRADLVWEIGLVSLEDGTVRILKTLGWLAPGGEQTYPRAFLSPDGSYVAYDYRPGLERPDRSIYSLTVDGSGETELVSGPGVHRLLGWLPDGSGILFYRERRGSAGIWRIGVRHGLPFGEPILVRSDVRALSPLGFTRVGYAYGAPDEQLRIHTAVLDLKAGRVVEPPRSVAGDPPLRMSLVSDWSPDGSYLAYVTHAPQPNAVETLVVRASTGEVLRTIPLSPTLHTTSSAFRWIDATTIILFGMERGRDGIFRMDTRDGHIRRLPSNVLEGAGNLKAFDIGPGARRIYFVLPAKAGDGMREIVARDVETGEQRVITTARTDQRMVAVSPTGDRLAYIARNVEGTFELRLTSTSDTGSNQTLYRAPRGERLASPVSWTPDASRVLFVMARAGRSPELWSVTADGEELIRVLESAWCCVGRAIRVHPDGQRIAFVAGRNRGSIWLLDGY